MTVGGSPSFKGRELGTIVAASEMENGVIIKSPTHTSRQLGERLSETDSTCVTKAQMSSLEPKNQRSLAALKLQKVYKSFRTRRQLADCAVLVEQRWWKLLDFAELKRSSISFFGIEKPETAASRWSRARTRAAKVGKGLSQDEKARKLALQHWLEAIDPRHRYGHNLQFYYVKWLQCESKQPFFYWLDIGEGKEINLERCFRSKLQQQCIKYLGPTERKVYEVVVQDGKLFYLQTWKLVDTREGPEDVKWIFVLSTSKTLYIGQKMKGTFQHSSFLAGGATLSAGRLVVEDGILKAVWPHSGHYLPTEENFNEFMLFLMRHNVDLSIVQKGSTDEKEDYGKNTSNDVMQSYPSEPEFTQIAEETNAKASAQKKIDSSNQDYNDDKNSHLLLSRCSRKLGSKITTLEIPRRGDVLDMFKVLERQSCPGYIIQHVDTPLDGYETAEVASSDDDFIVPKHNLFNEEKGGEYEAHILREKIVQRINSHKRTKSYQLAQQLTCRWTTGAGPRIGCMRDYPPQLQFRVLEEVNLSPRSALPPVRGSARSSPKIQNPTSSCRETIVAKSPLSKQVMLPQTAAP